MYVLVFYVKVFILLYYIVLNKVEYYCIYLLDYCLLLIYIVNKKTHRLVNSLNLNF